MKSNGKSGTLAVEDFEELSSYAEQYGARVLGQKIAKVCSRLAEGYKHEFAGSPVASAWLGIGSKISTTLGTTNVSIPSDVFGFLGSITTTYGPEVVIQKLAKIATRMNNTADASALKVLFPKVKSAPVASSNVGAPAPTARTGMGSTSVARSRPRGF